jgi:hypothetical protein
MKRILIIGAFDRYNYGDLLFPLIIEKQLDSYGIEFQYEYFGLVKSDLSKEGGKPTLGLQDFYAQLADPENKASVIVAGGEALGVTWNSLYAALNKAFQKVHRHHVKLSKFVDLNRIAKKLLKGKTTLPFVFDKADFPGLDKVVLNSLGGSGLATALFNRFPFLRPKLQRVDYLAVRDGLTRENLRRNKVEAHLFPDSAVLMSDFYPAGLLESLITSEVKQYVKENKGKYVFFQINRKTTVGKEELLAGELEKIYQNDHTPICLCPIGKALNHDDDEALQALQAVLKCPSTYFDAENIWDIMYLIANAKAYIGTSLHGAITSMSYAVPHVGLVVEKLDAYLNTWGVEGNNYAVPFDQIYKQYITATRIEEKAYQGARDKQMGEIKKAFDLMVKTLVS